MFPTTVQRLGLCGAHLGLQHRPPVDTSD
jgi:hypothetical protein